MKRKTNLFLIILTAVIGAFCLMENAAVSSAAQKPMARKIVVFKAGALNESAREHLINQFGGVKVKNLNLIDGQAVLLPPQVEKALTSRPEILRIEDDIEIFASAKPGTPPSPPAETLTWGVQKIKAPSVWPITTGDPIKVAIIDTGIDIKHPDLQANLKGGMSAVSYTTSYNDDNGHGTHVAGIIAAVDNEIGVIGVGPKIDLYAVKVLNKRGSGYLSDIIEGLDWVIANGMQVVNMSLGTASNSLSFQEAIRRVNAAGIIQVAAAGNSGGTVEYPAAYPEVIAVSATDKNDLLASWSSRGAEVDLTAPGVSIYSTYKGQAYATLSGTSMAAPHVSGTAALVLTTPVGAYDLDGDSMWNPIEVQNKLEATAGDLGIIGRDNLYGAGLINAEKAVIQ